jgi:hypothetical protein
MPLGDDVHATVDRYRQEVGHATARIRQLGTDVEALIRQVALGGPLGDTADADLDRARRQLARAAVRIAAAASAVGASADPAQQYAHRAFPRA